MGPTAAPATGRCPNRIEVGREVQSRSILGRRSARATCLDKIRKLRLPPDGPERLRGLPGADG